MSKEQYSWHHYLEQNIKEKHIFDLINSENEECTPHMLQTYLMKNFIPMEERYFYYLAGKYSIFPPPYIKELAQFKSYMQDDE